MPSSITSALSSLGGQGGALGGALNLANLGSIGYNLYNQYQNQQYQNLLRSYAQNPAKMNAYAAQFTDPLNAGLTTGVANQTQAYLAQRGLSDSPQISEQVEDQAIAKYLQQNQQQGYQDALQALGLAGGAIHPSTSAANGLSGLSNAFSQLGNNLKLANFLNMANPALDSIQTMPVDTGDTIPYLPMANFDTSSMPNSSSIYTPDYLSSLSTSGQQYMF